MSKDVLVTFDMERAYQGCEQPVPSLGRRDFPDIPFPRDFGIH
jgi:hypothetical protein